MASLRYIAGFKRPPVATGIKRMASTHRPRLDSASYPVRRLNNVDIAFADKADAQSSPQIVYSSKLLVELIAADREDKEKQHEKDRIQRDFQTMYGFIAMFAIGIFFRHSMPKSITG